MAKQNFIFDGKLGGTRDAVLFYKKENSEKPRRYFTVFQTTSAGVARSWEKTIRDEKNTGAKLMQDIDENGKNVYYVIVPTKFYQAAILMARNGKYNELENAPSFGKFLVDDFKDRPTVVKVAATAAAVLVVAGIGAAVLSGPKAPDTNFPAVDTSAAVVKTTDNLPSVDDPRMVFPAETTGISIHTQEPTIVQETQEPEDVRKYVDYDSLTYKTWTNSAGNEIVELSDALNYAKACFDNVCMELEAYNASVPENKRYTFDASKFDPTMYVGKQLNETSLFSPEKMDREKKYRGPFQIGDAAAEEANKISMKLTGKKVFENPEDFFDPIKACRASIYIDIQNYMYLDYYLSGKNIEITSEMVHDAYNKGAKAIANKVLDGTYEETVYPLKIDAYAKILDKYFAELEADGTDGSHDEVWKKIYLELYGVTEQSVLAERDAAKAANATGAERGE